MIGPAELLVGIIILFVLLAGYVVTRPRKVYTLQNAANPSVVYPEGDPHVYRNSVGCAVAFVVVVLAALFGLAYSMSGVL